MEHLSEKKWFVYMDDHHEGPFSLLEIQTKMTSQAVKREQYVWAEGMQDWKQMTEVPDFQPILSAVKKAPPPMPSAMGGPPPPKATAAAAPAKGAAAGEHGAFELPIQTMMEHGMAIQTDQLAEAIMPDSLKREMSQDFGVSEPSVTTHALDATSQALSGIIAEPQTLSQEASTQPSLQATHGSKGGLFAKLFKRKKRGKGEPIPTPQPTATVQVPSNPKRKSKLKWALLFGLIGIIVAANQEPLKSKLPDAPAFRAMKDALADLTRPLSAFLVEKVPVLGQWLSPLPALPDVDPEDFVAMRSAATAPLSSGPKVEIGLSRLDPMAPAFYLATNLPDGTHLQLLVEGVAETLLDSFGFVAQSSVLVQKKFAKSKSITQPDGKPIPTGLYQVRVTEQGQDKKIILEKRYFLRGIQDANYQERLKKFHEMVREEAKKDFVNLAQTVNTLAAQYDETIKIFTTYKPKYDSKAGQGEKALAGIRKGWTQATSRWVERERQMQAEMATWTPEVMQGKFYALVYERVKQAEAAITRMHLSHEAYFTNPTGTEPADAELSANKQMVELMARLKAIEESLQSATGYPKRE